MYRRIEPVMEDSFLGLCIQDEISDKENKEILELIEYRASRYGPVRLLVAYEADTGLMGAEDLYYNMRFAKQANKKLAKMAVLGEQAGEDTWIALFGLFGHIQTAYYDRGKIQEAVAWLLE